MSEANRSEAGRSRVRMTGKERREQLVDVGRALFAEKGFEATSIEEIASRAGVSKPVVYEHFGGKEGLYAVVVDREMRTLLDSITTALTGDNPRALVEQAALTLLTYIEEQTDGFRILSATRRWPPRPGPSPRCSTTSPARSSTSWCGSSPSGSWTPSWPACTRRCWSAWWR
ncbi:MAG TPA: TetR/AcrR family transcriptional regulator [Jatrophihabitans sp.]|nr:TetR/AcrR family transcriptional regulator [Jatrophihabitans sp.]